MSVLVLVVCNNSELLTQIETALREANYRVLAESSPIAAIDYLDRERPAALLTEVNFDKGQPNGIALARMARIRYRSLPVLFLCTMAWDEFTKGIGETLILPLEAATLVATVGRMIGDPDTNPPEAA